MTCKHLTVRNIIQSMFWDMIWDMKCVHAALASLSIGVRTFCYLARLVSALRAEREGASSSIPRGVLGILVEEESDS